MPGHVAGMTEGRWRSSGSSGTLATPAPPLPIGSLTVRPEFRVSANMSQIEGLGAGSWAAPGRHDRFMPPNDAADRKLVCLRSGSLRAMASQRMVVGRRLHGGLMRQRRRLLGTASTSEIRRHRRVVANFCPGHQEIFSSCRVLSKRRHEARTLLRPGCNALQLFVGQAAQEAGLCEGLAYERQIGVT